jgi:3-oxoacyl-[acyl-carrier-protein] synthase II
MDTKVVVTGLGVVSPVGNTLDSFWSNLCAGVSGIGPITQFDTSDFAIKIAGESEDVVPRGMGPKDLRRRDRYGLFALEAADQAWEHAGFEDGQFDPKRCGVVVGSGIGGIFTIQEQMIVYLEKGARRLSPFMVPKVLINLASGEVGIRLGLKGPNKAIVTACATGNNCIGEAADLIRLGRADVILAGGAEASIVPFPMAGFAAIKALTKRSEEPQRASRPFDADRDGFVMGEGAGILVMESEAHAKARGANILAEFAGHGETCDAHHVTAPAQDGSGAAEAMRLALDQAEMSPDDVSYFNAHGTSTKYNEIAEAAALHTVFGDRMPPVSSTKSMTGHLLGAAGAAEAIACIYSIRDGVIPPNINFETPDPECEVNLVANEARKQTVDVAMSNGLGFGGHNSSVIFKRYA